MQAQIIYKLEWCTYPTGIEYASTNHIQVRVVHISNRNWICRHRSYTSRKLCTYPSGVEHAGTPYKFRIHIHWELNMQVR